MGAFLWNVFSGRSAFSHSGSGVGCRSFEVSAGHCPRIHVVFFGNIDPATPALIGQRGPFPSVAACSANWCFVPQIVENWERRNGF